MKKLVALILLATTVSLGIYSQSSALSSQVIINEVKTDGSGSANEYVTIFNQSSELVDLAGWQLEYAKSGVVIAGDDCRTSTWGAVAPTNISGTISPGGISKFYVGSMLDDKGGVVRLSQISGGSKIIHDLVGWGDSVSSAPCSESLPSGIAKDGQTLMRCIVDGLPSDSDNNQADFFVVPNIVNGSPPSCPGEEPTLPQQCAGVVLTEIMSTSSSIYSGPNGEAEFIELQNQGGAEVDLSQCSLLINGTKKPLSGVMAAGEVYYVSWFKAGNIRDTAGQIILETSDEQMIVNYPSMGLDKSYILIPETDSQWAVTSTVTPGAQNSLTEPSEEAGRGSGDDTALAPCRSDQFRNPATNRCKLISATSSSLKACRSDQFRNPETNRCKSISSATSTLKPCQPDQVRNPETNRCKKISSSTSLLKPCKPGQVRNLETNRCRKVIKNTAVAGAIGESPKDDKVSSGSLAPWIIGLAGGGIVFYGIYEWRSEIMDATLRLRDKFGKKG